MQTGKAFERFAPTILRIYHRNKEAFWAAVMTPFLAEKVSLFGRLRFLRVGVGLLSAFNGLERDAQQLLKAFSAQFGQDVTLWKSNRPQYFKDAYPIFAFLAVWMDEEGLHEYIANFASILEAGVYAVAGYGILDVNVDSNSPSSVEILTAQALIAEYETLALRIFGVSPINLEIMRRMRTLFLRAEIKEKVMRGIGSPYSAGNPKDLGSKGANSVTPFMLCLERLGRASLIEDYWEVFLLFGAAIQMIDDWNDLEGDLRAGHFSYVTLGLDKLPEPKDAETTAHLLRGDMKRIRETYRLSKDMIAQSRAILARLNDTFLVRLVDVTEARLDSYFRKDLSMV